MFKEMLENIPDISAKLFLEIIMVFKQADMFKYITKIEIFGGCLFQLVETLTYSSIVLPELLRL
jgi:hypothetical protein